MAVIDSAYAQWLMAEARWVVRENATQRTRWGETALTAERTTGIAAAADAEAEADRELAFLGRGPFAIDVHQVGGTGWIEHLATVITLEIAQLGYDAGLDVFLLEAECDHATKVSTLAVLRPLRAV